MLQAVIINAATKIFNNRGEEQKTPKLERDQVRSMMLAKAIQKGVAEEPMWHIPHMHQQEAEGSPRALFLNVAS